MPVMAAVDEILDSIRQSEFRFARSGSEVPFIPMGWLQYRYYPATSFHDDNDVLASAEAEQHSISFGAIVPVYVDQRDMLLVGGDLASDAIRVKSGPYNDQRVTRITPVATWLHQFGTDHTSAAFVAPFFSKEYAQDRFWSTDYFAGMIVMYWHSDTLQWLYGGVYESYFGQRYLYPYFGALWNPTPQWSASLLFPWPAISYAPAKGWLLKLGIAPGGFSWLAHDDGYESAQEFGTWNTTFSVSKQLQGSWWIYAGAGVTAFRSIAHVSFGNENRLDAQTSPLYMLGIEFRP